MLGLVFFLKILRPPRSTRTDTLFPYTTLFRSEAYFAKLGELLARRPRVGIEKPRRPGEGRYRGIERISIIGIRVQETDKRRTRRHILLVIIVTQPRSEERRVGKGWVGTCRARGCPYH